jgi:peptide/nickel transport system substrate-binding protein
MRDVRFRRALSLAINRHEINQVVYFGLAIEGSNTVLPQSPLFRPEYQSAWTQFDLKQANDLLDELGLTKRNSRGVRLLPDGRPLEVIVETAGESSEQVDCLELIRDSWIKAGVKLYIKPSQREVFRNRIFSGDTMMSVWSGLENGLATADQSPEELAPTSQQQLQWPKWGQYFESGGKTGEPAEMPAAQELLRLNDAWRRESNVVARTNIWAKMLSAFAEQVFSIGVISGTLQPVVVSTRLRNVPPEGIYNWEPGAHFGIYRPDHFWLDQGRKPQAMK